MKAEIPVASRAAPEVPAAAGIVYQDVTIRLRSRLILFLMRHILKPMFGMIVKSSHRRIAKIQLQVASARCPDSSGLPIDYQVIGRVPGQVIGSLESPGRPVILWLHGGAFILPAAPQMHLVMVAKLCRQLGADGFVPDYRLAPFNRFPAGLDDCERAYRALLDKGHAPSRIVIGGDSAGGNLTLGVLQRIRKAGLPMPACAVLVSPVTEMGRIHAPPSRGRLMNRDPLLPVVALERIDELYAGDWDASDPELSPLYMDCSGLPPMFFLASTNEILMDETLLLVRRAQQEGAEAICHIWPFFPHAFPLFESWFPEVRPAREAIADFARQHLKG